MKKLFVLVSLFLLLMSSIALAKPQTYTATGEYVMSPKETLEDGVNPPSTKVASVRRAFHEKYQVADN